MWRPVFCVGVPQKFILNADHTGPRVLSSDVMTFSDSDSQPPVDESPADAADAPSEIRVTLKPRKAMPFFSRHPWVFESAIDRVEGALQHELVVGTPVKLYSSDGEFIAHGLWNEASKIRLRLYSWDEDRPLDSAFWKESVATAIQNRARVFPLTDVGCGVRLIFSEADFLSGLTVDLYDGNALAQFTSAALYQYRSSIVEAIQEELQPRGIWLRTEKGMREAEGLVAEDGLIAGVEPPRPLFIVENGIQFGVDVQQGQKTGCYLDQRDNRRIAARYLCGDMLDAFCFSGGFGITALKSGNVDSVLAIDSSEAALTLAAANAELNGVANRIQFKKDDVKRAFTEIEASGRKFDSIVIDPPRMARTRGGLKRAIKGYSRLNQQAVRALKPNGILVTCSCSGLVSRLDFQDMLREVSREVRRPIQILEQLGQPADHPVSVSCPETEYLKVFVCRVL